VTGVRARSKIITRSSSRLLRSPRAPGSSATLALPLVPALVLARADLAGRGSAFGFLVGTRPF